MGRVARSFTRSTSAPISTWGAASKRTLAQIPRSNIHAGTGASNVIPGACVVDFNLRFAPVSTADSLIERIEAILRRHRLEYEAQWTVGAQPFMTQRGVLSEALARAIEETTGRATQLATTGGTSDGRFLATICAQVIELGPTNATIHKIDECIRVADIEPLKNIYRRTLELLLKANQ